MERMKGNRNSIARLAIQQRTDKKQNNRKSTNKIKMKHRNEQSEDRGNNK